MLSERCCACLLARAMPASWPVLCVLSLGQSAALPLRSQRSDKAQGCGSPHGARALWALADAV